MPSKPKKHSSGEDVDALASQLLSILDEYQANEPEAFDDSSSEMLSKLSDRISVLLRKSPAAQPVEITLGRPDGIARYFAFCFVNRDKIPLPELAAGRFQGSGVYAIYYHGSTELAYKPISGTETPIYVGKADPEEPFADTPEKQGNALHRRLKEHARSIHGAANLNPADFHYRYAVVQSGMQAAVEAFMIQLFKPIWNKETRICFGIGKHGDSANTRRNKRSPWDTMHPGRAWATATLEDQRQRHEVESDIKHHFAKHGVIKTKKAMLNRLAL